MTRTPTDPLAVYTAYSQAQASATPEVRNAASDHAGASPQVHARITARIEALRPELVQLAQELYADPELGFEEVRSAERIAALVERHGVAVERGTFGLPTSFVAKTGAGAASDDGAPDGDADEIPHVAVVAEYDALPGIGHGCGHNIIAAIATGAFLALAAETELPGRVSLIGAPAEEGGGGKELILRAGGFDDVDAAGMVHPSVGSTVSPIYGGGTSGVRRVAVTYHGRAGHAAGAPYLGLNALDAVVTAYTSIAQLRQHTLPIDRIHGIITDGGTAPNVVPERASAEYLIRSSELETLAVLTDRVVDILDAAALATGTRAEITLDYEPAYLPLRPNVELNKRWAAHLTARGRVVPLEPTVVRQGGPSTDMGNVSWYVPSIHPALGLGGPPEVIPHNAGFADTTVQPPAFDALVDAAIALAGASADFLADAGLRAAVRAEFEAKGGRRRWSDVAPDDVDRELDALTDPVPVG